MSIRLVVGAEIINVFSVYAPQVGLAKDVKREFWEELEGVVQSVPPGEKLFLRGDFNGHIGSKADRYDTTHGSFGYGGIADKCQF